MYRASEPDSAERNMTLKKIEQLSQAIQQEIDAAPSDPVALNHWAWLISNTTGDYDKALRFSQKSLELRPDTASFLDTLGRCYFAVGDLENAIKYQRQAVELEPSTRILKRQLDEFEAALAKQQGEQTPHDA
jgi:tetratricopeptide (TPR) repeat protein